VYFAEWDEPMISGIGWVSELIEAAGGIDIFADRTGGKSAKERIVTAEEIIARAPDIIIGSWVRQEVSAGKGDGAARFTR
jgi:iron complex transport system substrate-binding protein